ncbi:MAG TPA: primosomal protein N' [Longimicrobiaceae bacterium]|nr:primosomal protein N' [Longimicrobiaceae bacterium]
MFAEVALPLPLHRTFTYRVPDEQRERAEEGARVLVPFGRRERIGWIDRVVSETDVERVRDLHGVLDASPTAPPELLRLARWIADYYLAPLGQVLRTALPAALCDSSTDFLVLRDSGAVAASALSPLERRLVEWLGGKDGPRTVASLRRECGDRVWWPAIRRLAADGVVEHFTEGPRLAPPVRTHRVLRLTREMPSLRERGIVFARARRQRECYELLESIGGVAETAHLTGRLRFSASVLKGLVEKGLAEIAEEEVARDPYAGVVTPPAARLVPTAAQADVIASLVAGVRSPEPGTHLLRGITGSGKTLVYIELLREVVERQGRTAIVLVPEIALTPQTVGRFKAEFGERVAVLHSALSDGERYDEWRALRSGEKRIVVGARSAIFAPLPDLGAIVVDEEHESSYKQADAPRYHAREVAVVRARMEGALCLLGSATPSLESWANANAGKYTLHHLPGRAGGQPLPPIRVVDLRAERKRQREAQNAAPAAIFSEPLVDAMRERLRRGEQTILLLNRRGYATFVQCRECGQVWHCPQCNVSLTYHRRRARLTCHYCFHEEPSPDHCSACGSSDLSFRGVGTEQVERSLGELLPDARIARMDVDTTSGKWAHHEILGRVERGEVQVLLGTQMIAKGLDFPNVTLVGVINADVGINLPDFRATERTFQLITQVAGRAGRGPKGGEVIVQTALPGHYAIECAVEHDFLGFAERELEARRSPAYPPHARLLNVVVSGLTEEATHHGAERAAQWIQGLLREGGLADVELIGPAPCPIDRLRGRWRWHLLLRAESPGRLARVGRFFAEHFSLPGGKDDLRVALDRDPVQLL